MSEAAWALVTLGMIVVPVIAGVVGVSALIWLAGPGEPAEEEAPPTDRSTPP